MKVRREVAWKTLAKNLIAPLPYRIWRGGVSEDFSLVNRVRGESDGITSGISTDENDGAEVRGCRVDARCSISSGEERPLLSKHRGRDQMASQNERNEDTENIHT